MKKLINNMKIIFCLIIYLMGKRLDIHCLSIEYINGYDMNAESAKSDKNANQILDSSDAQNSPMANSADRSAKWVSDRECPNGSAKLIQHNNVAIIRGLEANHFIQHDAL